jgi:hypothetical protein
VNSTSDERGIPAAGPRRFVAHFLSILKTSVFASG